MASRYPPHVLRKLCMENKLEEAFHVVGLMDARGERISRDTVYFLLQVCTQRKDFTAGMHAYNLIVMNGLEMITVLADHLIRLFDSCGCLADADAVFSNVSEPSIFTWNAIISAHSKHGTGESVLVLYKRMQEKGTEPSSHTFLSVVKACGCLATLYEGRKIHDSLVRSLSKNNLIVQNALVHMYAQCGAWDEAAKLLDGLSVRDVVSWGTIFAGFSEHGNASLLMEMLEKMQKEGIKPERVTFLCILKACGSISSHALGRIVHDQILKSALESDVAVGSALVDMYAKCTSLDEAQKVFDGLSDRNVVSWGALLGGYVQHGLGVRALNMFELMKLEMGKLDASIYACILKACGIVKVKAAARLIYTEIIECGFEVDTVVGSALVDAYVKCGSIEDARMVFDKLPHRDVITWGVMIEGYAQNEQDLIALVLFEMMQKEGIFPDKVVFLGVAKACGSLRAIKQGLFVHNQVVKGRLECDLLIGNSVIDMYGKCGSLEDAWDVFDKLPNRDAASWSALAAGFARSGNFDLVRQCLEDMQRQGMKPGVMIFSSILTACSHAGLLKEGWAFFKSMKKDHNIIPNVEHCNCMFDILGRLGCLHEAEHLLEVLPTPPDAIGWMALLTACKTYGNVDLAKRCFKKVLDLDPHEGSVYLLMASIYAGAQMWEEVDKINKMRSHSGVQKKAGMAWIEVNGQVHEFTVGGQCKEASKSVEALYRMMQEEGYVPALESVLEPLQDRKEAFSSAETVVFGFAQCT